MEGVPLVACDLLLEHDEKHADGDEEFLPVPDLCGYGGELWVVADPGVEQEDKRPDDESCDNGDFAEALARQAELEDDRDAEIENEEWVIGCVAELAVEGEEPGWNPDCELDQDEPPGFAQSPGSTEYEGADDAER